MMKELFRYYNAAKIFRFFLHHRYIYKSIFRDLLEKHLSTGPYVKPRNIVLKLHSTCDAKCEFCYAQKEPKYNKNALTKNDWKGIIDQAKELGCYTVTLSGGEPLIYPHLVELVDYVRTKGMLPFTATNGLTATPMILEELEKAGLCALNWSLHGPRDHHDKTIGVDGAFDNLLENGEYCAKRTKIICLLNHVATRESIRNKWYLYVWKVMRQRGFRGLNLLPICVSDPDKSDLLESEDLVVYNQLAKQDYVLMDTKNYSVPMCPAARDDLLISDFGEVQPCPFIPITFGNIKTSNLKDVFIHMQKHSMFEVKKKVCVAAMDHNFIDKYIVPAFNSGNLPANVDDI